MHLLRLVATLHCEPVPSEVESAEAPLIEHTATTEVVVLARVEDAGLVEALVPQLADLPLHLSVHASTSKKLQATRKHLASAPATPNAVTTLWLSARGPQVTLYLHDGVRGRLFRRSVERMSSAFATYEVIAFIARRALVDLTQGGIESMDLVERPPALAPAPPSLPPPPPPPRGVLRISAGYAGESLAPQASWQSAGEIGFGWTWRVGVSADATYSIVPRLQIQYTTATLNLRHYPLAVALGYEKIWSRASLRVDVRANADIWTSRTSSSVDAVTTQGRRVFEPGVGGRLRGTYLPKPWVGLFASAGAAVFPTSAPWVMRVGEEQVLLAPRKVRPRIAVGVEFRWQVRGRNPN